MGKGEEGGAGCLKRWGRERGGGIQLKQRTFGWPSHVVNGGKRLDNGQGGKKV